jgi:hypothetical protein
MPQNLKTKVFELLPTGPGPFRGELTRLVESSAKELEQARLSRGETDLSRMTSEIRSLLNASQRRSSGSKPKFTKKIERRKATAPYHREDNKPFRGKAQRDGKNRAGPQRNRFEGHNREEGSFQARNKNTSDASTKGTKAGGKSFNKNR